MDEKPYSRGELVQLIKEVVGLESITPMISNQINNFIIKFKMTYKEIARCIVWYTEVQGKELNSIYGLGMVPNIREEANKYFKQLELDQQRQKAEAQKVTEYQDNNIIFHISSIDNNKRVPKKFDMSDIKLPDEKGDK